MKVAPFHSRKNPSVFHVCSRCMEGNSIEKHYKTRLGPADSVCVWRASATRSKASVRRPISRAMTRLQWACSVTAPRAVHRELYDQGWLGKFS